MFKPFSKFDFLACGMKRHLSIPEAVNLLAQYRMKATASDSLEDYLGHQRVLKAGLTDEVLYGELVYSCNELCIEDTAEGKFLKHHLCFVETDYFIEYIGKIKKFDIDSVKLMSLVHGSDAPPSLQPVCSESTDEKTDSVQSPEMATDVTDADLEQRIANVIASEVIQKKEKLPPKWARRLPVVEDAIEYMAKLLRFDCRCSHDILAEIAYTQGTDRNQERFSAIGTKPENAYFGLETGILELAKKLVPEERVFGLAGKHNPEKCNCTISDHRKMTKKIRQHRKESSSDP